MAKPLPEKLIRRACQLNIINQLNFTEIGKLLNISRRTINHWALSEIWEDEKRIIEEIKFKKQIEEQEQDKKQYSNEIAKLMNNARTLAQLRLQNGLRLEKLLDDCLKELKGDEKIQQIKTLNEIGYDKLLRASSSNLQVIVQASNQLYSLEAIANYIKKNP